MAFLVKYETPGGCRIIKSCDTGSLAYKMAALPIKKETEKQSNKEFIEEWKFSCSKTNK